MSSISLGSVPHGSVASLDVPRPWLSPENKRTSRGSQNSTDTVQRAPHQIPSSSRPGSHRSANSGSLRVINENASPQQNILPNRPGSEQAENREPDADSCTTKPMQSTPQLGQHDQKHFKTSVQSLKSTCLEEKRLSDDLRGSETTNDIHFDKISHMSPTDTSVRPKKWLMGSFWPHRSRPPSYLSVRKERWSLDDDEAMQGLNRRDEGNGNGQHHASSRSPSGLRGTIKAATANFVKNHSISEDADGPSERHSRLSLLRKSHRKSRSSNGKSRESTDVASLPGPIWSQQAINSSIQRKEILEEILSSEEGYLNDLKVLIFVYFGVLCANRNSSGLEQMEVERIITEIAKIHDSILKSLTVIVKSGNIQFKENGFVYRTCYQGQSRNTDASRASISARRAPVFGELEPTDTIVTRYGCDVSQAGSVAELFSEHIHLFYLYDEYAAAYDTVSRKLGRVARSIPTWGAYERGVELLVNSLVPPPNMDEQSKKSLTFEDLLIKPLQRICRYPLLFTRLLKQCPGVEDPEARVQIESTLHRLSKAAIEANNAKSDIEIQSQIRRTRRLRRLVKIPEAYPKGFNMTSLGPLQLCGVLYVAYQSTGGKVQGQYMLSALFDDYLVLARQGVEDNHFVATAIIGLRCLHITSAKNETGLHCRNALHTWKLVYKCSGRWHEIICCGCSEAEEIQWTTEILRRTGPDAIRKRLSKEIDVIDSGLHILGNLSSYGNDDRPGSSIKGYANKLGSQKPSPIESIKCIIRNTHVLVKESSDPTVLRALSLDRALSVASLNRLPVLSPERSERIAIEHLMGDIWSHGKLPYPGIAPNRSSQMLRHSASSVMRKLSKASITSRSSLQSMSAASITEEKEESTDKANDDPFLGQAPHPFGPIMERRRDGSSGERRDLSDPKGKRRAYNLHNSWAIPERTTSLKKKSPPRGSESVDTPVPQKRSGRFKRYSAVLFPQSSQRSGTP